MATRIKPCFSSNLTVLSWNIAMTQPSAMAPPSRECTRLIYEECLASRPDVIALQECPYPTWGSSVFDDYISVGCRPSHCGYVDLLLHNHLAADYKCIELRPDNPSVAASFVFDKSRIAISSSHLAPFKDGFPIRAQQCNSLMSVLSQECTNCVLLGDFNMRAAEDEYVEKLCGGGWVDAWKGCGSEPTSKFTWNSFVNRYHDGGFKFKARFDRCYIRGDALKLKQFSLAGNSPVSADEGGSGASDYLSDHFGLLVKMDIEEPTSDVDESVPTPP